MAFIEAVIAQISMRRCRATRAFLIRKVWSVLIILESEQLAALMDCACILPNMPTIERAYSAISPRTGLIFLFVIVVNIKHTILGSSHGK